MNPVEDLRVMIAGWRALQGLRHHASRKCGRCAKYRQLLARGVPAKRALAERCEYAQDLQRRISAAEEIVKSQEGFDCEAREARDPECVGPVDLVFTVRRRYNGKLIRYAIGCEQHVRMAEGRAVARGSIDLLGVEKLDDTISEIVQNMKGN